MKELIICYSKESHGLPVTLRSACLGLPQTTGLSEEGSEAAWEIDRVAIHITEKDGSRQM